MEFSIRRLKQVAKILAEEIKERLAEKEGINEMEQMMRELVKEAAGLGIQQAIEQGEERYARKEVECRCGEKAKFVSKREAVLWTVFGKVSYQRRYYLCAECHQGQSSLGIEPGQVRQVLSSLLGVLGVEVAFEEASQLAERFLLFRVSDNTVRKQTEGYGNAQAQAEKEWKKNSGYHVRSLAETTMFRLKTIFGDSLSARLLETQTTQALIRCAALNKILHLGMPQSSKAQ